MLAVANLAVHRGFVGRAGTLLLRRHVFNRGEELGKLLFIGSLVALRRLVRVSHGEFDRIAIGAKGKARGEGGEQDGGKEMASEGSGRSQGREQILPVY